MIPLKLTKTTQAVSDCWIEAEGKLREQIKCAFPHAHENDVTVLFQVELAGSLRLASECGRFQRALLEDLERTHPTAKSNNQFADIAKGLVAEVRFHDRTTEAKSGGDFGLVVARPSVSQISDMLRIDGVKRGLLCQAKMRRQGGRWGSLTPSQRRLLAGRTRFLALVLYEYSDADRHALNPFD